MACSYFSNIFWMIVTSHEFLPDTVEWTFFFLCFPDLSSQRFSGGLMPSKRARPSMVTARNGPNWASIFMQFFWSFRTQITSFLLSQTGLFLFILFKYNQVACTGRVEGVIHFIQRQLCLKTSSPFQYLILNESGFAYVASLILVKWTNPVRLSIREYILP
jgi:hypothetical protein